MRGASEQALTAAEDRFEPVLAALGPGAATVGDQLFAVVDLLEAHSSLRRALTDPGATGEAKAALVTGVLGGRVDGKVVDLLAGMVRGRWSSELDLLDAVAHLAAVAVLAAAQAGGDLERVEDELFRVDRLLVANREVRAALADRRTDVSRRLALVRDLLADKVAPATLTLVSRAVAVPRKRSLTAAIIELGRVAAARRRRLVAKVTAASVLTTAQRARVETFLTRRYGRQVQLNVSVDPAALGGLRIQVGADVIDTTVRARLDDARRRLAG
ncbi:F0F1 ATP synthase subunit delta [Cellulomonas phragmiteti]|uniref:ATP synthase subunit delta n=1 Tax=Cellulomonas phragmiteti TaxID=478780 RepID=A0ABQ4DQ66_9CELL|nr:F0F1 ATP synthase subunit delta [Cellulomonas phragmiteti]GIG41492.1 ATP synthase subunit delta [Cellulomonas phragmiteti]